MGKITTVGIDLAKNIFSVHALDESGRVVIRKTITRARLMSLVAQWHAIQTGLRANYNSPIDHLEDCLRGKETGQTDARKT